MNKDDEHSPLRGSGWGIFAGWRYEVREVVKVTSGTVTTLVGGKEMRTWRQKMLAILPDEAGAIRLAERLTSAKAEKNKREASARLWFTNECARLIAAESPAAESRDAQGPTS